MKEAECKNDKLLGPIATWAELAQELGCLDVQVAECMLFAGSVVKVGDIIFTAGDWAAAILACIQDAPLVFCLHFSKPCNSTRVYVYICVLYIHSTMQLCRYAYGLRMRWLYNQTL